MKKILFIFCLIFFIGIKNISGIAVYPQQINFLVHEGEFSCENVTILSYGNIVLNDKWAKKNLNTKDILLHIFPKASLNLYLDYPKEIFVFDKEKVEVCFSGNSPGVYHGVFLAREENSNEGVGIWINATILKSNKNNNLLSSTGMSILEDSSSNPSFLLSFSGILLTMLLVLLFFISKRK